MKRSYLFVLGLVTFVVCAAAFSASNIPDKFFWDAARQTLAVSIKGDGTKTVPTTIAGTQSGGSISGALTDSATYCLQFTPTKDTHGAFSSTGTYGKVADSSGTLYNVQADGYYYISSKINFGTLGANNIWVENQFRIDGSATNAGSTTLGYTAATPRDGVTITNDRVVWLNKGQTVKQCFYAAGTSTAVVSFTMFSIIRVGS